MRRYEFLIKQPEARERELVFRASGATGRCNGWMLHLHDTLLQVAISPAGKYRKTCMHEPGP